MSNIFSRSSIEALPWQLPIPTGTIGFSARSVLSGMYYSSGSSGVIFGIATNEIPWIPRYISANYNPQSLLRNIYHFAIESPALEFLENSKIIPQFYSQLSCPRTIWAAKYNYPTSYIPKITLSNNQEVLLKSDYSSFLYEKKYPVAYRSLDKLILRNLANVSVTASSSSGIINLSTLNITPTRESGFYLEDDFGDTVYIDRQDFRYSGNTIYIGYGSNFTITYESSAIIANIDSGSLYVSVGSSKVSTIKSYIPNLLDNYSYLYFLNRKSGEDNLSLKSKCQALGFGYSYPQRLASFLGCSQLVAWNQISNIGISGSGYNYINFSDFPKYKFVYENLENYNNKYYFTYLPSGFVQVLYNGLPCQSSEYSISNYILTPLSSRLTNATQITVNYVSYNYTVNGTAIVGTTQQSLIGVLSSKVLVNSSYKRVVDWRWNKTRTITNGLASFN
jgi:hypothetical protein